jgi:flagellar hook-basal body complex protein FliE
MSSINSITGSSLLPEINPQKGNSTSNQDVSSFGDRVKKILGEINDSQLEAGEIAEQFATGEIEDVHDVMIAAEKAGVGLELVLEVRNRLIEAYREVTRMQM